MDLTQQDIFKAGEEGIAIYRIPSLIVAPGGTLLAFCEARKESCNDATPTDLVLKRSADGGRTWSSLQVVVHGKDREAIMNPCPAVYGKTIILFCMNAHKAGRGHHRYLVAASDDDGITWTQAADITEKIVNCDDTFVPGPGVGIRTRSGRIVMPGGSKTFNTHKSSERDRDQATCSARAVYSDDGGQSWRMGRPVASTTSNESQVVELSDGALMLNWREQNYTGPSAGCRGTATSRDGGETWSEPSLAHELNETPCQASILRYDPADNDRRGNILLFSNNDVSLKAESHSERIKMTVRLSYDGGKTWPVKRLINLGPSAYSCLAVLPDKTIALLYECGDKHPYERLRLAKFSLEWLAAD